MVTHRKAIACYNQLTDHKQMLIKLQEAIKSWELYICLRSFILRFGLNKNNSVLYEFKKMSTTHIGMCQETWVQLAYFTINMELTYIKAQLIFELIEVLLKSYWCQDRKAIPIFDIFLTVWLLIKIHTNVALSQWFVTMAPLQNYRLKK